MPVRLIIIDGRHAGYQAWIDYSPTYCLPITDEIQISMGESHDNSVTIGDYIEYKECFRSVDKTTVLYSTHGKGDDIRAVHMVPTYPVTFFPHPRLGDFKP